MSDVAALGVTEGVPYLDAHERAAIRAYWHFFDARASEITSAVHAVGRREPAFQQILDTIALAPRRADSDHHALVRAAIFDDVWCPYFDALRADGARYAHAGISYSRWFELIRNYRTAIHAALESFVREAPDELFGEVKTIAQGMNIFLDLITQHIGEGYIAAKEQLVVASEARYRKMFAASPLPMWLFDTTTLRFVDVNDAAVAHYGYSRAEFLGMTVAQIRPPEDVPTLQHALTDPDRFSRMRGRHIKKDGATIHVEVHSRDFSLADRKLRLAVVEDITAQETAAQELRTVEDQLRQVQKMEAIGTLAGGIAHDFNNVLTVIVSYAALLEESLEGDARHEDAAEIRRASERAEGITRHLLAMSRHSIAAPRPVDLDALIGAFAPTMRRLLGATVNLTVRSAGVPSVVIDPGQMEQVLMNLVVNGRDAMPGGGQLVIETSEHDYDAESATQLGVAPGRYSVVAVSDAGSGMDLATQKRIFEPFFTTKDTRGTGLGLSIVHGIVTQAKGAITVYSELRRGTTFRVHLPVSTEQPPPVVESPSEPSRQLPPLTILVVDDQEEVRAVASRILQSAGCRVLAANSAERARQLCVSYEGDIDVALVDVILADARGDHLARQLLELRPTLRCVLMSGYPAGALDARGAAPADLLAKPFTPADLRAAIARVATPQGAAPKRPTPLPPGVTRVLLVDDDPDLRQLIGCWLERAQIEVVDVDGGRAAIAQLETRRFDVVLSDVQMPDGGGVELLKAIRRIDLDIPVILMTGAQDLGTAAAAIEYGAFRYLAKPLEATTVVRLLEHAARAHALARLRREAFSMMGAEPGAVDRAGLEVRFEQALSSIYMVFQPIVHARDGATFGHEALMRSHEVSLPHPQAVVDAAVDLRRLPSLGRRVRELTSAAFRERSDLVFVNLHPEDLWDADLAAQTAPLSSIASRVVLEITERASLTPSRELTSKIEQLRRLGFRIAVDDIGAGYSGLTTFTELTPEIVKIDMSLIRDVHKSTLKQRTITALVRLCHEVDTLVVAEGVESPDEHACLVDLGCDLLQGYLFARPARELS